jgi:uncharacterized protein
MSDPALFTNHLAHETSPYLKQHAHNPVDWYAWGSEALRRAKELDRPIFLSIGYSACHWCHVMEHESFENEEIAKILNDNFVSIKVDREERPDLDQIYMTAVQRMTGQGGWPMTVFLTPDLRPFTGGTYFPPEDKYGRRGFRSVLLMLAEAWRDRRAEIDAAAGELTEYLQAVAGVQPTPGGLDADLLRGASNALARAFDASHGGFGQAPKFLHTMDLRLLLRVWKRFNEDHALHMVRHTLDRMAMGGIYDHLGGGFARYSTDDRWFAPHFEKMLYDNALLVPCYIEAYLATKEPFYRQIVEETLAWVKREMTSPEGPFYSTLDADSEGHEGKFYVWSADELDAVLGEDAPLVREYWGVTADGNFEGRNILFVADVDRRALAARHDLDDAALDERIATAKRLLYDIRSARVWPGLDDKVLASWNGLMIRAFADAARAFDDARYRTIAVESAAALFGSMVKNGRVFRSSKAGRARIAGYLEDYASLALAALALSELTFDETWIERARTLADSIDSWFRDDDTGLYFDTASDQETLINRPREVTDNATPAGTSLAAELFVRLAELTGDDALRRCAAAIVDRLAPAAARYPMAFGHLLSTADLLINGAIEVAIAGAPESAAFRELARVVGARFVPGLVLAGGQGSSLPLLAGRAPTAGVAAAFVCRNYACELPVTDPTALDDQLAEAARASSG